MNCDLQKKLSSLETLISIQRSCLERGYMHGMLNGLIAAHSAITDNNPIYESLPRRKTRNKIRHKSIKK